MMAVANLNLFMWAVPVSMGILACGNSRFISISTDLAQLNISVDGVECDGFAPTKQASKHGQMQTWHLSRPGGGKIAMQCCRVSHLLGKAATNRRHLVGFRGVAMKHLGFSYATATRGRRVVAKAQDKEEVEEGPLQETAKPFYATIQFWLQAAVVILTFGFVDAGYSGDWSRIGALSQEAEAQLRVAAYGVVPCSAALVFAIGNQRAK